MIAALVLDAALGWPKWLHARIGHPVGIFAAIINYCEKRWNRAVLTEMKRRIGGVMTVLILMVVAGGTAGPAQYYIIGMFGEWAWLPLAFLAWPAITQRSLYEHVLPVLVALIANDLVAARDAVGMIVGRDTGGLDAGGVARAGTESLAESFCDGVVAPVFWLVVAGLPGIWVYKAINTADSLIGHPEPPLRAFGWAAARTDDLLNLVPARLSGILLCLAAFGGWRIMCRDHSRHASPNAGWPEAAMAGALSVRLAGPVSYDGVPQYKQWIGEGPSADSASLERGLTIYIRACSILWVVGVGLLWLV